MNYLKLQMMKGTHNFVTLIDGDQVVFENWKIKKKCNYLSLCTHPSTKCSGWLINVEVRDIQEIHATYGWCGLIERFIKKGE